MFYPTNIDFLVRNIGAWCVLADGGRQTAFCKKKLRRTTNVVLEQQTFVELHYYSWQISSKVHRHRQSCLPLAFLAHHPDLTSDYFTISITINLEYCATGENPAYGYTGDINKTAYCNAILYFRLWIIFFGTSLTMAASQATPTIYEGHDQIEFVVCRHLFRERMSCYFSMGC